MTTRYKNAITTTLALLVAGAFAPQAFASGFQLREQSPSAQGNAFAGISAGGSDISSMFFNPATMTQFEGFQLVIGASSVAPKAELGGAAASRASYTGPLAPFAPYGGTTINGPAAHPNSAKSAVLPNLYAMWSLTKDFKLGLSLNAPFGMVTEYDSSFVGRYHALKSDLKVVDVGLNAAYRFSPMFSVGATLIYRKVEAELTNAVDMGQIAFLSLASGGAPSSVYGAFIPSGTSSIYDGKATVKGDTSNLGYKVGLTFEPTKALRIGLGYQASTKPKVEGTVAYDYPTVAPTLAPYFNGVMTGGHLVNGTATAEVDLPDTTSLGVSWDLTPGFNLAAEAARTGWSKFKDLTVKFGSGQGDSITHENWRNTMFYSLGATWKATEAFTLRVGLASDQGAVEDAYRTPRIPDGDRTWYSGGFGYAISKGFGVDFAYTHITVKDGPLVLSAGSYGSPDFFRGNLTGTFKNSIDIVALSARITF